MDHTMKSLVLDFNFFWMSPVWAGGQSPHHDIRIHQFFDAKLEFIIILLIAHRLWESNKEPQAEAPPPVQPGRLNVAARRRLRLNRSPAESARGRLATAAAASGFNEPRLKVIGCEMCSPTAFPQGMKLILLPWKPPNSLDALANDKVQTKHHHLYDVFF